MVGLEATMFNIEITSGISSYSVQVNKKQFAKSEVRHRFWIVDSFFRDFVGYFDKGFFLNVKEELKTLETCASIIGFLAENGCNKKDSIGVLGGGFSQDIGTLVSSLYMRGVRWSFYPTTLMAMMDSCIGGKSSINVAGKKNLAGNFYPPNNIDIFTGFINSLNRVEIASGLLEAIKICFANSKTSFEIINRELANTLAGDSNDFDYERLIAHSLQSKKWFLESDEFDQNERQLLNFGHTFGHALESATEYMIPHGIAIGYGMLAAIDFLGDLHQKEVSALVGLVRGILNFSEFGLRGVTPIDYEKFCAAFDSDKKHSGTEYRLILPGVSGLDKVSLPRNLVTRNAAFISMNKVLQVD